MSDSAVLGILVCGPKGSAPREGACAPYVHVARAAARRAVLCGILGPEDIEWASGTATGYVRERDRWVRRKMPLPTVIYNRIPDRTSEATARVVELKKRLRQARVPYYNPGFFSKSNMYDTLAQSRQARRFVPESLMLERPRDLYDMVNRHGVIYCKPAGGSLGMGILRIERMDQGVRLRFRGLNGIITRQFDSVAPLYQYVRRLHPSRRYVVQQGIDLLRVNGQPADFRVHLHKGIAGEWSVVGIGAKVSGPDAITTHVRAGGFVEEASKLFSQTGQDGSEVEREIQMASVVIAKALERRVVGIVGELGLDVGLDREGHIWVFEANAKPGRTIFKHPSLRAEYATLAHHILDYTEYLTKHAGEKEIFAHE